MRAHVAGSGGGHRTVSVEQAVVGPTRVLVAAA